MEDRRDDAGLPDFRVLASRLSAAALLLGALAFVGVVVEGLGRGLSFRLMGRWLAVYVLALLVVAAALTAAHALRGMHQAQTRGERLGSDDVGLLPRRRGRDEDDADEENEDER